MAKSSAKKDSAETVTNEMVGSAPDSETAQATLDVEASVTVDPPEAANDPALDAVHTPEVQSAISAVTQEIDEAVAAVDLGAEQLDLKPIKSIDESGAAPARKRFTPAQGAKLAQRRMAFGEKLLLKQAIGVAHVKVDMTIKHSQLANLFKRAYPMCDLGLHSIIRHGGDNLGTLETRKVLTMLETMIDELRAKANETYSVALAMVSDAKSKTSPNTDMSFTALTYIPAYDDTVTARSPLANQLLHCYKVIDSAMCELENLHWSGARKYSEIELEFNGVKAKVNRIADLVRRTVKGIDRKHREVFGEAPRSLEADALATA